MSNNFTYLLMRGMGRFLSLLKYNPLSFITLITFIFIYNMFWVAGTGSAGFLNHLSNTNTIRVYLSGSDQELVNNIKNEINEIPNVLNQKYYSPKHAREFVIANAPQAAGLNNFSEEFFPAFIEVTPTEKDERYLKIISESIKGIQGVEDVSYGKDYISKFKSISHGAWLFILAMTIMFSLSAIFIIYNTIKLSLYNFKEEIKLYSLVGATRPFIALPYIFAALFMGLSSFIISAVIFIVTFTPFNNAILYKAGINIFSLPDISYFFISCLSVCIISVISAQAGIVSFLKQVSSINED